MEKDCTFRVKDCTIKCKIRNVATDTYKNNTDYFLDSKKNQMIKIKAYRLSKEAWPIFLV